MKYKIFKTTTAENADALLALSKDVGFRASGGSRTRIGANGEKALSIYSYSKWLRWNRHQRKIFKDNFHPGQIDRATQCWFLEFPAETGFLDIMNTWVDDPFPASIVSMSLKDGQIIDIDGEEVVVNKGELIGFKLSVLHSVPKTKEGQIWACTMSRASYTELED